jgi:hypothetical protein
MVRKQKTIHYLYKTTCVITGRWYIGMHSTHTLDDGYLGSGRRLRASIRKHGEDNHVKEILEFFENRELLVEAEINAITEDMIGDPDCMNLMGGGEGGFISEEQQRHRSVCGGKAFAKRLKEDEEFKKIHRKTVSDNMKKYHASGKHNYNTFEGKTHSDETKKKMSEAKKGKGTGKTNSQYGTCWITNGEEVKKIKKENLNSYLEEGWRKGRK